MLAVAQIQEYRIERCVVFNGKQIDPRRKVGVRDWQRFGLCLYVGQLLQDRLLAGAFRPEWDKRREGAEAIVLIPQEQSSHESVNLIILDVK